MIETAPEIRRLPEAFASLARGAEVRTDCPEPDRLWRAVGGELPPTEIRELVDHTASCPSCAEDWRLAREIGLRGQQVADRAIEEPSARAGRPWYLAAAAALALAAGAVFWSTARPPGSPAEYRNLSETAIRSLTPEEVPLPRGRLVLRWAIEGEAVSFDLRVATEDLETLSVARELQTPEYHVPASDLESLAAGDRVLWQVEALLPDGTRVVSPTYVNRLE